jgi:hypothetical protein
MAAALPSGRYCARVVQTIPCSTLAFNVSTRLRRSTKAWLLRANARDLSN